MVHLPLRTVALPEATGRAYDLWLDEVAGRLGDAGADWYRIARDVLYDLYYPGFGDYEHCLLYTSPSPRDRTRSRMPSSA